jgi:hypothetical protein
MSAFALLFVIMIPLIVPNAVVTRLPQERVFPMQALAVKTAPAFAHNFVLQPLRVENKSL